MSFTLYEPGAPITVTVTAERNLTLSNAAAAAIPTVDNLYRLWTDIDSDPGEVRVGISAALGADDRQAIRLTSASRLIFRYAGNLPAGSRRFNAEIDVLADGVRMLVVHLTGGSVAAARPKKVRDAVEVIGFIGDSPVVWPVLSREPGLADDLDHLASTGHIQGSDHIPGDYP